MPLLILAGSDRRPGPVPANLSAEQMLRGTKGALPLPWGKCLVAELIERFRGSGCFADPLLVGPRDVYGELVDCEIIDVSGTLAATLGRVLALIDERFDDSAPLAVSTCDILPTAGEIRELLDTAWEPHRDCSFWWQLITCRPEDLEASAWKPHYRMRGPGGELQTVYPGHLAVLRPKRLRLELLNRLLAAAYRSRNRTLRQRFLPMLLRGVGLLVAQDLKNLARGQWPVLTFSVPWHCLQVYSGLRKARLTFAELERHIGRSIVHRRYRRSERPVVVSPTSLLWFAKDIDTLQELDEAIRRGPAGVAAAE